MTARRAAVAAFVFSGLLRAPALHAAASAGGQVGSLMFFGAGGRALAMGSAYYAISDDATAAYYNPAGLTQLQRKEISFMQTTLGSGAAYSYFGGAWPTKGGSTFAVSMAQLSLGGFEKVDVAFDGNNEPETIASGGSFNDAQQAMALSWAKNVSESLSFGMSLKQLTRSLSGVSDNFKTMDVGILTTVGPYYRLGFGLQNVFALKGGLSDDKLPVVLNVGNSFRFFKERLTLAVDGSKPLNGDLDVRFGGEYWVVRWFAFRFGLMGLPGVRETDFGFGLKFNSVSLDIAQGIHDLGTSTRMGLSFRFGKSRGDRSTEQVNGFIKQGNDSFLEGDFAGAAKRLNSALDAQPGNKQVQAMLARLMSVSAFVPQATGGEEFQVSVRKGVISYVDGRDLRQAVNSLRHAFNKNPKDEKLLGLLNMVEKEAGVSEVTRRIEGPEQFTWVDQKIYDARQSVYDGKYDSAVRRSQDVLDLEPNNVTALEIMGSAFYMMEQRDKALAIWKRVLELDPENQAVKEFLQRIK